MSHFLITVIIPKDPHRDREQTETFVGCLLEPFNENREVPEYPEPCYCVGSLAAKALESEMKLLRDDRKAKIERVHDKWEPKKIGLLTGEGGTPEEREAYNDELDAVIDAENAAEAKLVGAHPDHDKADPECEDCKGSGTVMSQRNPDSAWDWWCVGGRFTGTFTDYEPSKDPANIETCRICSGSGTRPGGVEQFGEAWAKGCNGCNGCRGTGKEVKFPSHWTQHAGDIIDVSALKPDFHSYAIVTPDGVWHAKGEMGWWGMDSNRTPNEQWKAAVRAIVEQYKDFTAVAVDAHI